MNKEKFYITTAIDYINAKPHIGHAYEKVAADVLARFWAGKIGKDRVRFLTGTDEHGSKIAKAAEAANQPIEDFARETAAQFSFAWDQLNIAPDRFIRTTDEDHIKTARELISRIKENGYLYEDEYSGYYCVSCETFYTETEAPDHVCPVHKTPLEFLKEKNWFLKIGSFLTIIEEKIKNDELKIWPAERKNEILSLLKQGFHDIAISRPNVKWGIPLPWDESQTIYVWVEALMNYVTGAKSEGVDWWPVRQGSGPPRAESRWWPADIHIIGKDIIKFHCIIWPAILLAAGLELPKSVVVHGYLTVGGEKMSKSLGNVIDPNDWVAKYGSDAVRYLLMREVAFGEDGDVSEEKLKARYEGELANGLGNLVSRVTNLVEKFLDGKVDFSHFLEEKKEDLARLAGPLIEKYDFHGALKEIWDDIKFCNEQVDRYKLWELAKNDPDKFASTCRVLLSTIFVVASELKPFMPETSKRILEIIQAEKITKAEPLFPKIQ